MRLPTVAKLIYITLQNTDPISNTSINPQAAAFCFSSRPSDVLIDQKSGMDPTSDGSSKENEPFFVFLLNLDSRCYLSQVAKC